MDPDTALFAHVVEAGSLSAAARMLGISPAMVSKRIARLERRLGVRLLERSTRRLEPTPRGARFYHDVSAIMGAIDEAEIRVSRLDKGLSGRLRVSAPTSFGRLHIAPYLKDFLNRHPGIELEIDLSDEFIDLGAGKIDLAIRIAPGIDTALGSERLASSRRVLCASPAYLAGAGMPEEVAALDRHRLIAAQGQLPWRLAGPKGDMRVNGVSHVRTNSSELVRELVLAGMGIALRSLWDVGHHLARGELVRLLPDIEGSADVGIHAAYPQRRLSAQAQAFIAYFQAIWSPVPPWEV